MKCSKIKLFKKKMHNCPISLERLKIPVITDSCNVYDFVSIATWILNAGQAKEPISQKPISSLTLLKPLLNLHENIEDESLAIVYINLINRFPFLKIHGVGELSFLKTRISVVEDFYKSLEISRFAPNITLFHLAAHLNNLDCMKMLYRAGVASLNAIDANNTTALHYACAAQNQEIVQWLLSQKGIDINARLFDRHFTPLHLAVCKQNVKLVCLLLKYSKIDINLPCNLGFTPIEYAVNLNNTKILDILLMNSSALNLGILYAHRTGKLNSVRLFLEYYIHQMIHQPAAVDELFKNNPSLQSCLAHYQDMIWDILTNPGPKLNLGLKFPHYADDDFDKVTYYTFLSLILEQIRSDDRFFHPILSIFPLKSLNDKFFFLHKNANKIPSIGFFAAQETKVKYSSSSSCLTVNLSS